MFDPVEPTPSSKRTEWLLKRWYALTAPLHRNSARRHRAHARKLIGITGSVGKSSATHLLSQILAPYGSVATGIARNTPHHSLRTIRKLRAPVDFVVQEVSGGRPGDIASVIDVVGFDGAIITTIGADHLEAFGSLEGIAAEKGKLAAAVPPSGFACLNIDDPFVAKMRERCVARVVTYGTAATADVRAVDVDATWPRGMNFTLVVDGKRYPVTTQLVTSLYLTSVLGALAAVHALGLDLRPAIAAMARAQGVRNRFEVRRGTSGHIYLLDSMKASHWSTLIVFKHLPELGIKDLVVVLGQVSDIKNDSSRQYRKMIRGLAQAGMTVIGVGPASGSARKIAGEGFSTVFSFDTREQITAWLKTRPPSVILLKGGKILPLNAVADADGATHIDIDELAHAGTLPLTHELP
jgi:UDP-N-acetylmuramoyl-tripeptide--D-alanyl-D-alanine ligase